MCKLYRDIVMTTLRSTQESLQRTLNNHHMQLSRHHHNLPWALSYRDSTPNYTYLSARQTRRRSTPMSMFWTSTRRCCPLEQASSAATQFHSKGRFRILFFHSVSASGKPNQDGLLIEYDESTRSLIAGVFDGHGEFGHIVVNASNGAVRDI